MSLFFTKYLKKSKSIQRLLYSSIEDNNNVLMTGAWGTLCSHIVKLVNDEKLGQGLIITSSEKEAKTFVEDLRTLGCNVLYYPAREIFFFDVYAFSHDLIYQRLSILNSIISGEPVIVVASAQAIMQPLVSKDVWEKSFIEFKVGHNMPIEGIAKMLVDMGYDRVDKVETKGHFSVRGGILDIYPPVEYPVRIEFFDDEIDSIRIFDPATQISIKTSQYEKIFPCSEIILTDEIRSQLYANLEDGFKTITDENQKRKFAELLDNLKESHFVDGLESYMSLAPHHNFTLLSYMASDAKVYIYSESHIKDRIERYNNDFQSRFQNHFERGALLSGQIDLIISPDVIFNELKSKSLILMDTLAKNSSAFITDETIAMQTMEAPLFNGNQEKLLTELKKWKEHGYIVVMAVSSVKNKDRLTKELLRNNIDIIQIDDEDIDITSGSIAICSKNLCNGFVMRDISYVLLTDKELFGVHKKSRSGKKSKSKIIKSFNELNVGDYVVHETHGIGKYESIEQLEVDGQKKDYMKILYGGDDRLYIPVENMDLIQKYIGKEADSVRLSKLGGVEWKNAKSRARKYVEDMTDELLELYAQRKSVKGYAYGEDTEWQKQFEDMFPYEETPDQLRCIDEIKADMQSAMPMERLLCGDVGYGKTEVAIRAVFKAAMESKQVVFLVPTTLLAKQHYDRFKIRFSKFPIKVDMLSRFKSAKEQRQIVKNLKTGVLDVVIGTHRVLSDDVEFKDLGLLIIDEEQRFGVKHKEKIKKLKKGIDVLSLTATPIPRTLHMSMIGIRDMSVIEDAPDNRYPVQTYVTNYDEGLIIEAIERETDRGGQVFFVHNRVKDIDRIASKIQNLLPDVKIQVAHGQMSENSLEKIMMSFLEHEFDVLVCTTIIETGLDISNVNTMIINNADKMGLAQLYQLRGRVGRSNRSSYSYLMYSDDKVLSESAEKRLQAIKAFTELGSGFKIAMKDLEIRGTGNILGASQSGHMATVGYEMFVKMIEDKMRQIKGQEDDIEVETTVEYNISAYIPEEYVENPKDKIELYKKIASIRNKQEAFDIEEEIEDRYGTLPKVVYNLINVSYVKALGRMACADYIKEQRDGVYIYWQKAIDLKPETIILATQQFGNKISIDAGNLPNIKYKLSKKTKNREKQLSLLIHFMEQLVQFQRGNYKLSTSNV